MTPDRTDHTPDEPVNGVLSDTGSLDTAGIGILGGATAQVNVELPTESDDDRDDDGVIDDEVPFVIEIPADADLPIVEVFVPAEPDDDVIDADEVLADEVLADDGHAEVIEDAVVVDAVVVDEVVGDEIAVEAIAEDEIADAEAEPEPELASPDAEAPEPAPESSEDEPATDVAVEPATAPEASEPVEPSAGDEPLEAQPEAADGAFADEADEFAGVDFEAADFDTSDFEFDGTEFDLELTDEIAEDPMTAHAPEPEETDAAASRSAATDAPAPPVVPAAAAAAAAATAPAPATRREAQHTGAVPVVERQAERAVDRIAPRPGVALTSKRLGEFEAGRETSDLLTADRLLDPHQVVKPEPEGTWQHFVYSISGKRINLGDSKRARARKEMDRRIAAPLTGGARFVPVLSRKGGVGKTTVTTLLGMALADARDDRVIAVDANPDRGTLAERISRDSGKTVRDLVRISPEVVGFNDLSNIVARDETRLDVVASDTDPRVSEAFNDADYRDVAALAAHYYSVVLTDTGTGIVHSVMGATLDLADQIVIVAGLSVDEARLASETLTWLETNGYSDKVRSAIVVLNNAKPGHPLVQLDELEAHFRTRVRAVVRVPYDAHIAAGSAIVFRELQPATRDAARELAATVVEGLRTPAVAA
ncbi:AAA family ATPase [Microbacterium kyungheense]|uniref:MinD-like ATPase involved in chromosome partitioning or flagellar assembly n=1 Tax=Microbacterium kyungheense TaxID=1263636 RepID=A0A543FM12_9MICO|nr:AAA family ATPase [Microbacterium kyungheense]TQM34907.1 MinD-like ATPase involved in chromosome partitioning or flagellar assembly [Microbacterium kyungheense]